MKRLLTLAFLFLSCAPLSAADGPVLARDGKSDYVIVVPENPSAVETTAAKELQSHLEQVTGAKLEILAEDKTPAEGKQILVGACKRLAQLVPDVKLDKLGYDGIVIKTVGDNLVLAGHPKRGTLYAVYSFLEDTVGCRWWTSTEGFVPKKPTLTIPKLDMTYTPKIRIRETYYCDAFNGVFAARSKCNGNSPGVPDEFGGHERFAMFVHTFFPLLPPEQYFAKHPEWYSEIGGKRTHEGAQLCVTNEEARKELTRNALGVLRKDPGAGRHLDQPERLPGPLRMRQVQGGRGRRRFAVGPAAPLCQCGGRGHREGIPQRARRDARLPVHANAAESDQAAAQRRRAAVLDRVLVRPAAFWGAE